MSLQLELDMQSLRAGFDVKGALVNYRRGKHPFLNVVSICPRYIRIPASVISESVNFEQSIWKLPADKNVLLYVAFLRDYSFRMSSPPV